MKICKLKVILMFVIVLSLFMVGCASGKNISSNSIDDVPWFVAKPPRPDGEKFYGIGRCKHFSIAYAQELSDVSAIADIIKQLKGKGEYVAKISLGNSQDEKDVVAVSEFVKRTSW